MRLMNESDYKLYEGLIQTTQETLLKVLGASLKKHYDKVIITGDYLIGIGDIPIALVAHLDTVFSSPPKDLYYDQRKGILWSPDGMGADDRAGVFSILKILQAGLRPSVIFTTFEETGGIGAEILGKIPCPISGLKYLIELDRRGTNDCVFYQCDNKDFIQYVSSFGFVEKFGSFTDISILMSDWNICGVNLSVGYENEHTVSETLHVGSLYSTIDKVILMLKEKNIPNFEYIENKNLWGMKSCWDFYDDYESAQFQCAKCKHKFSEYEMFPVKGFKPGTKKYYCPDCIASNNVDWCDCCGEPFEVYSERDKTEPKICQDCAKKIKKSISEDSK